MGVAAKPAAFVREFYYGDRRFRADENGDCFDVRRGRAVRHDARLDPGGSNSPSDSNAADSNAAGSDATGADADSDAATASDATGSRADSKSQSDPHAPAAADTPAARTHPDASAAADAGSDTAADSALRP
jgi:hypothetical protein